MAIKRTFIKSSSDLIARELEKLQNKVSFLEASASEKTNTGRRSSRKTAVYSPPIEVDAKRIEVEFESDEEMFTIKK